MAAMNQLSQTVNNHILKTNTGMVSLQSKMKAEIAVMHNDLNTYKSEEVVVRSELATLLENPNQRS